MFPVFMPLIKLGCEGYTWGWWEYYVGIDCSGWQRPFMRRKIAVAPWSFFCYNTTWFVLFLWWLETTNFSKGFIIHSCKRYPVNQQFFISFTFLEISFTFSAILAASAGVTAFVLWQSENFFKTMITWESKNSSVEWQLH